MRHLDLAIKQFNLATDQAFLTFRQLFENIITFATKKDHLQSASVVMTPDLVRSAAVMGRRLMFIDNDLQSGDLFFSNIANLRCGLPVNHVCGQMPE